MLEAKNFHGVGIFEVHILKVSALKLYHPSACPVFKDFSYFSLLRHSLLRGGKPLLSSPFKGEVGKGMGRQDDGDGRRRRAYHTR
jgi:hypothetical protein